jgi:hypothetical protein
MFSAVGIRRLYGLIITATGWTLEQVHGMTVADANRLCLYWLEAPPTHIMVGAIARAFGGGKTAEQRARKPRVGTDAEAEAEMRELKALARGMAAGTWR